jgi:general stress protein YciG
MCVCEYTERGNNWEMARDRKRNEDLGRRGGGWLSEREREKDRERERTYEDDVP